MTTAPQWWRKPRNLSVVVDNPSWVLPYARELVESANAAGDEATLCRDHREVGTGAAAFYLGCLRITPPDVLARNRRNLVVHASDLPKGRGFSPLTWQVLEGAANVPVCLLEAGEEVDSGPVVYREWLRFEGHELVDEMRRSLGRVTVDLCRRFLDEVAPREGTHQEGATSHYARRRPQDSVLDPSRSIADQFDLLRVVDNERYPAFFTHRGHRYVLRITKEDTENDD